MKLHWVVVPAPTESLPAVIVEDGNVELTINFDLNERGVVVKRISGDDITADSLRKLRIGEIRAKIHESLLEHPEHLLGLALFGKLIEEGGGTATPEELEVMRAARRAADDAVEQLKTAHPKRGRAATNQDWYRRVAQAYLGSYQEHGQRAVKHLAELLNASPNTVYWWVRRAREEGWLTEGHQGRAGASPGPRLIRWQKAQEDEQ